MYHNAEDPETNYLLKSQQIREEVEKGIPARQAEFDEESKELGDLIDQTEPLLADLLIGDINEQVCGVNTEGCDESCGGAKCQNSLGQDHCGNSNFELFNRGARPDEQINTCDRSAYQMAKKAQTHSEGAKKKLATIQDQVEEALRETEPVREAVSQAKEKTTKVNEQVIIYQ